MTMPMAIAIAIAIAIAMPITKTMRFNATQQAETKRCLYNQTTHITSFNCLEAIHYFLPACDTADSYFNLRKSRFRLVEYCLSCGAGNKPGLECQWF
jgi:hypothetical protein